MTVVAQWAKWSLSETIQIPWMGSHLNPPTYLTSFISHADTCLFLKHSDLNASLYLGKKAKSIEKLLKGSRNHRRIIARGSITQPGYSTIW